MDIEQEIQNLQKLIEEKQAELGDREYLSENILFLLWDKVWEWHGTFSGYLQTVIPDKQIDLNKPVKIRDGLNIHINILSEDTDSRAYVTLFIDNTKTKMPEESHLLEVMRFLHVKEITYPDEARSQMEIEKAHLKRNLELLEDQERLIANLLRGKS